jgi:hypothetical protein
MSPFICSPVIGPSRGVNVAGHCIAGNFFATGSTTPAHLATGRPHCWRARTVLASLNEDSLTGAWGGAPRGHLSPTPRYVSVGHHSLAQFAACTTLNRDIGSRNSAEGSAFVYLPYVTHRLGHQSKTAELALRGSLLLPGRRVKQRGSIPLGSVIHPP